MDDVGASMMMEQTRLNRLNSLFEKMVSNNANVVEKKELNNLYQEYINDGRDTSLSGNSYRHVKKHH